MQPSAKNTTTDNAAKKPGQGRLSAAFRRAQRKCRRLATMATLAFSALLIPTSGFTTMNRESFTYREVQTAWDRAEAFDPDQPVSCLPAPPAALANTRPIIVIDPGHYYTSGNTHANIGGSNKELNLKEIDIIDAMATKLRKALQDKGWEVIMTRQPGKRLEAGGGDYKKSLSVRGAMPAFLGEQTGRTVIFVSLHVDDVSNGFQLYVQNSPAAKATTDSFTLARSIADSYQADGNTAGINVHTNGKYEGKGRFLNRAMRSFESARRACSPAGGASVLVEMGNINDPADVKRMKHMMDVDTDKMPDLVAKGITDFIQERYKPDVPPTTPPAPKLTG